MYKYYQYQIGPDVYTHRSTEAGADILTCRFHGNQLVGFCPKVLRIQVCRFAELVLPLFVDLLNC